MPKTSTYEQDALRDQLLAAAHRIVVDEGPAALRVRRLADAAGCSTMGVYSRFGSKNAIADELYRLGFRLLKERADQLVSTDDSVADLKAGLAVYRAAALAEPALYGLMFERAVPDFKPTDEARAYSLESFAVLVRLVERCISDGEFRKDDPDQIAFSLFALIHGLVSLELLHAAWQPVMSVIASHADGGARAFQIAIDTFIDGLR